MGIYFISSAAQSMLMPCRICYVDCVTIFPSRPFSSWCPDISYPNIAILSRRHEVFIDIGNGNFRRRMSLMFWASYNGFIKSSGASASPSRSPTGHKYMRKPCSIHMAIEARNICRLHRPIRRALTLLLDCEQGICFLTICREKQI